MNTYNKNMQNMLKTTMTRIRIFDWRLNKTTPYSSDRNKINEVLPKSPK